MLMSSLFHAGTPRSTSGSRFDSLGGVYWALRDLLDAARLNVVGVAIDFEAKLARLGVLHVKALAMAM